MKRGYILITIFYLMQNAAVKAQKEFYSETYEGHPYTLPQHVLNQAHHIHQPKVFKRIALYDSIYNWNWDTTTKSFDIYNYKVIDIVYNNYDSLVSEIYQSWNGITWVDSVQYLYGYNKNKIDTNWIEQAWNGTSWVNSYQEIYTYNSNNLNTVILAQSGNGNSWKNSDLTKYTYTPNSLKASETQYRWSYGVWTNADSILYTYNANYLQAKWVEYEGTSNGWIYWYQCFSSYNADNLDTNDLVQWWQGSNGWGNFSNHSYWYNSHDLEVNGIYQEWNVPSWLNILQWACSYDSNNNMISDFVQPMSIYAEPNDFLYTWTYDTNNIVLSQTYKLFDTTSTTVKSGDSTHYYFHETIATGINKVSAANTDLHIYPNPSKGNFNIVIASPTLSGAKQSNSTIGIYNVLGEQVYAETLRSAQGDNSINLSNQPNGVYLYRVISETGNLVGEGKVVIEH